MIILNIPYTRGHKTISRDFGCSDRVNAFNLETGQLLNEVKGLVFYVPIDSRAVHFHSSYESYIINPPILYLQIK